MHPTLASTLWHLEWSHPLGCHHPGREVGTAAWPLSDLQRSSSCHDPAGPVSPRWHQPGESVTQQLGIHQTPCWPPRLTRQAGEALECLLNCIFFVKGRKISPRHRRIQHLKIMLFHFFNIGRIMIKSKQNQLSPPAPRCSRRFGTSDRKRGTCCRAAVPTELNVILKTPGNRAYYFFL